MQMNNNDGQGEKIHIAMFPWFAMGHIMPYMHLSNKLADRGHRISLFLPAKTQSLINSIKTNHNLITLIPIPLPPASGLHPDVQTTSDCDFSTHSLLANVFDKTKPFVESCLQTLVPDAVFFDFSHWLPDLARKLGILPVYFSASSAIAAHMLIPRQMGVTDQVENLCWIPPDFPRACLTFKKFEAKALSKALEKSYGENISFHERMMSSLRNCDAIAFRTCRELEGQYLDYVAKQAGKPAIPCGPALPIPPSEALDGRLATWLDKFEPGSVIYCSFGSECVLSLHQFQELVLGLELAGFPFLVALRLPVESESVDSALPHGFKERTNNIGIVTGDWVQQLQILNHRSTGCFVTHCGSGSLTEGLVSQCQMVLVPYRGDQFLNARVMSGDLKVGVEVEKGEEDGLYDRYGVCKAVKEVMNLEHGVGKEVKINHEKWRSILLRPGLEDSYADELVKQLKKLISSST